MEKSYYLTKEMETSMALLSRSNEMVWCRYFLGNYSSVFLELHAGSGGEDACDWTRMLLEMYRNFAKNMGWSCHSLSEQHEGSGCHSGVLRIDGNDTSSYLSQKVEFIVSCAFLPLIKTVVVTPRLPLFLSLLLWRGPNRFRFFLLSCRLIDSDHQVLEVSM